MSVQVIEHSGKRYHLPFADLIPFDPEQDVELGRSIQESGRVEIPIIANRGKSRGEDVWVTDGAHRVIHAFKLGLKEIPVTYRKFAGEEEEREFVLSVNLPRRHLTPSQLETERRKRIERMTERRRRGESIRTIAGKEKVSKAQVQRDLAEASKMEAKASGVPGGGTPEQSEDKTRGRDKKKYPKTKPGTPKILCERCARVGVVKGCPKCVEARKAKAHESNGHAGASDADESVIVDAEGAAVPEPARAAFLCAPQFDQFARSIDALYKQAKDLADGPAGRLIQYEDVRIHLKNAKGGILQAGPTHVCPLCQGRKKDCACCKGEGWTAAHVWKRLTEESKR